MNLINEFPIKSIDDYKLQGLKLNNNIVEYL